VYFSNNKGVNIDITHRCALECLSCQRIHYKSINEKVPGQDMTIEDFKKVVKFFKTISFCGSRSDPVHHPHFIEFLRICNKKSIDAIIHNASSAKSKNWYIKAFKANPDAKWIFGIDGMPEQSHLYRINQDGKKLFEIMLESKKYLSTKPKWQYIAFEYNIDKIDDAKKMAKYHDLEFLLILSSRWKNNFEQKPKDPKFLPNG